MLHVLLTEKYLQLDSLGLGEECCSHAILGRIYR